MKAPRRPRMRSVEPQEAAEQAVGAPPEHGQAIGDPGPQLGYDLGGPDASVLCFLIQETPDEPPVLVHIVTVTAGTPLTDLPTD